MNLEGVSKIATIISSIVAAMALLWGAYTYYWSAQAQAEAQALAALREHWKIASDNPELSSQIPELKTKRLMQDGQLFTPEYAEFASHALFTAQSVYKLAGGEPHWLEQWFLPKAANSKRAWNRTVIDLAGDHDTYVLSFDFSCTQYYEQEFIDFLKKSSERYKAICPSKTETDEAAIENLAKASEAQQEFYKNEAQQYGTQQYFSGSELGRYSSNIEDLSRHGFRQGNPQVEISFVESYVSTDDYYCMQAPGDKYKVFRVTPYDDGPIPGSCE